MRKRLVAWFVGLYYTWRYSRELHRLIAMPPGARFLHLQKRGYVLVTDEAGYQVYRHGEGEMLAEIRFRILPAKKADSWYTRWVNLLKFR